MSFLAVLTQCDEVRQPKFQFDAIETLKVSQFVLDRESQKKVSVAIFGNESAHLSSFLQPRGLEVIK
jgi:hypothetical protein